MLKRKKDPRPLQTSLKNEAVIMLQAFKKRNHKKLRKLNDKLLSRLIPHFSKALFELTVASYVLSKVVSKQRFLKPQYEERMAEIEKAVEQLTRFIDGPETKLVETFNQLNDAIRDLEKEDPRFLIDLITKGRLKVAAVIYAQGVSLGVAAEMTEMNKQDILNYAGKTMMTDRVKEEKSIAERMNALRRLMRKKHD